MKKTKAGTAVTDNMKKAMDELEFPQEYTGPLLNVKLSSFSPRVVPDGKLTTPRLPGRAASSTPRMEGRGPITAGAHTPPRGGTPRT